MKQILSRTVFSRLGEIIAARTGLHFPEERWDELGRKCTSIAHEFGFNDLYEWAKWLLSTPLSKPQTEILASHLTVGETYFFREKPVFDLIETQFLPKLISSRARGEKRLRIWSAGCCTGEEPYSIAISVANLIQDIHTWNISILATDINPRFIEKASKGIYGKWSFRGTSPGMRERYFTQAPEGRSQILPALRKMVTFAPLNLAEDPFPSPLNDTCAMDLIFCRNVLMYLTRERSRQIIRKFHQSLVPGGWLIVGPSEAPRDLFQWFAILTYPGAIILEKPDHERESAALTVMRQNGRTEKEPSRNPDIDGASWDGHAPDAEASGEAMEALSRDEPNPEELFALARECADSGKLSEALDWCGKAIAIDKLNPVLYYLRASILLERNQADAAADSYRQALFLAPDFALAHFALGNLALRKTRPEEARKHFGNAVSALRSCRAEDVLPCSGGMTVRVLMEVIRNVSADSSLFDEKGGYRWTAL